MLRFSLLSSLSSRLPGLNLSQVSINFGPCFKYPPKDLTYRPVSTTEPACGHHRLCYFLPPLLSSHLTLCPLFPHRWVTWAGAPWWSTLWPMSCITWRRKWMEGGAPRGSPDQVPFSLQIQTFWEIVLGGGYTTSPSLDEDQPLVWLVVVHFNCPMISSNPHYCTVSTFHHLSQFVLKAKRLHYILVQNHMQKYGQEVFFFFLLNLHVTQTSKQLI